MKTNNYVNLLGMLALTASSSAFAAGAGDPQALSFKENRGQVSDQYNKPRPDVLFSGSDGELNFHLKQTGISYQLSKVLSWQKAQRASMIPGRDNNSEEPAQVSIYRLDISWLNCSAQAGIEKGASLDGFDNYYYEVCPNGITGVKSYKSIRYNNLYNGINLEWYERSGHLKYDYQVAAGADYRQIAWEISGALGIDVRKGSLVISTPLGELIEEAPIVVQDGRRLAAQWNVRGNRISFDIEGINASRPFVIDPLVRLWGTFYGGSDLDNSGLGCVDKSNNAYLTGQTRSTTNIATVGGYQTIYGGNGNGTYPGDAFIAKFNPQGVRQWATYYGGTGCDYASSCAADASGNVYFVGGTNTTNSVVMVTAGCHQPVIAANTGIGDALIVKLSPAGARLWATYYGDTNDDWGLGCCVDANDNLFLCGGSDGVATNTVLATAGAHQTVHGTGSGINIDAYLAKFSPSGTRLWGTYYGGSGNDNGITCKTDLSGNVYLTGPTASSTSSVIATAACHQYTMGGGLIDAFLVKFDNLGTRLWGTYYGGTSDDYATSCDVDKFNNVYMAGSTASPADIATAGAFQPVYVSGRDGFFVKFNASGVRQFASYYGGSGTEDWPFCALDGNGNIYLAGATTTGTSTRIATPCAYQPAYGGGANDCFLAKFDVTGNRIWGTYYGGSGKEYGGNNTDFGPSVMVDAMNDVYLTGYVGPNTSSLIIASPGSHQPGFSGGTSDAFLVKFDGCRGVAPTPSMLTVCAGTSATISSVPTCSTYWYSGPTGNNLLFPGTLITSPLTSDTTFYGEDLLCGPGLPRIAVNVTVVPSPTLAAAASSASVCAGESLTLTASGTGVALYTWMVTPPVVGSVAVVTATASTVYSVSGTGSNGCERTATVSVEANICVGLGENVTEGNMLYIYPNPNAGEFTIRNSNAAHLRLLNSLGQTVKELDLLPGSSTVQLSGLASGIYFAEVENDKGKTQAQKIIVSR